MKTPKDKNHKIKTKRYTFLLVSDIDAEKSCFLCRVKTPYQQILIFLGCRTIAPEENCPPVRVRVWFRVSVRIKVEWKTISLRGNCPRTVS